MQEVNLTKMTQTVTNFFREKINNIDRDVKFVKRQSKLTAELFAEVLINGCLLDPTISLERLCKLVKDRKVKITKQGLHQRFTGKATELMKGLLGESLKQFMTGKKDSLDLLKPFSAVAIIDSTGKSLPNDLKDIFKGHGGSGSEAGLKLQVLYDYIQGQISTITVTGGVLNDQGFDGYLEKIQPGALYLQDLGYFKSKSFKAMNDAGAYFISRYSYPTAIFNEHMDRIDLLSELKKGNTFFMQVYMGKAEKVGVRLICQHLPEKECEERVRKLRRKAQKSGRSLTKETLELAKWSIYITNVPEQLLKDEQVYLVYTLRWQIELLFKLCKSEAGLAKMRGKKPDRILCELYAKMICVIILLYLCFPIRWQETREISFYKAYKALKLRALELFKSLTSSYRLVKFVKSFLNELIEFSVKDRYKKKKLTYQKIMAASGQELLT